MLTHRDRRCDAALAQNPPAASRSPGEGRRLRRSACPGNQPGLRRPPCRRPSPGDHGHCGYRVQTL